MTDREIKELCDEIDRMARRVGGRFMPDPEKIANYKRGRDAASAVNP